MKRRKTLLGLLALILLLCVSIQPTLAYFTDYVRADGKVPVVLGSRQEIRENFGEWIKDIQIENTEGEPVWIRAKAFIGATYDLEISSDGSWFDGGDGWWYHSTPVYPKDHPDRPEGEDWFTGHLYVKIGNVPAVDDPDHQFSEFNVGVIFESTLVRYNEAGEMINADESTPATADAQDWTLPLDTGTTGPSGSTQPGGSDGGEEPGPGSEPIPGGEPAPGGEGRI